MLGNNLVKMAVPYFLLTMLSMLVISPIMSSAVNSWDHSQHYIFAVDPSKDQYVSYPLFHITIRSYKSVLPSASKDLILFASVVTFMTPLPLIIYWALKRESRGQLPEFVLASLALGLMIIAPITIWADSRFLLGYFNPIAYHNPTSNILRLFLVPLALVSLMVFECQFSGKTSRRVFITLASAALVAVATLTKPSYTIALIPGLCLFALWRFFYRGHVDWRLLILGFILPAVLILGGQYLTTYSSSLDDSSIRFGFLTYLAYFVPRWRIPLQFLLSIAFPAVVYLFYRAEARQDLFLNLSWLVFGVGAMIAMLVYEVGPRWNHGNFLWTSYSAIFVLMFASLRFLVKQYAVEQASKTDENTPLRQSLSLRHTITITVFVLHIFSGIAYYVRYMST